MRSSLPRGGMHPSQAARAHTVVPTLLRARTLLFAPIKFSGSPRGGFELTINFGRARHPSRSREGRACQRSPVSRRRGRQGLSDLSRHARQLTDEIFLPTFRARKQTRTTRAAGVRGQRKSHAGCNVVF